jgi:predicted deacylase
MSIPVQVVNGTGRGPSLWICAAIHGDELNGVEIIRRVLESLVPSAVSGTVIAAPIVNVFGFIQGTRYLPDRRDLNRSFPGSRTGSLAARIARLFLEEIVSHCSYGIDLHTGSDRRTNLPQVRADLEEATTRRCALAFGAPVVVHARLRDGSLRAAATGLGCRTLVFEGGEADRFDDFAIEAGTEGVLRVLAELGIIAAPAGLGPPVRPFRASSSQWIRARRSGVFRVSTRLGERLRSGSVVGTITDTFGARPLVVRTRVPGIVVGMTTRPIVNRGDALVHVALRAPSQTDRRGRR